MCKKVFDICENINIFNLNNVKYVFLYNIFSIVLSALVYKRGFAAGRALHLGKTIVG